MSSFSINNTRINTYFHIYLVFHFVWIPQIYNGRLLFGVTERRELQIIIISIKYDRQLTFDSDHHVFMYIFVNLTDITSCLHRTMDFASRCCGSAKHNNFYSTIFVGSLYILLYVDGRNYIKRKNNIQNSSQK